MTAVGLGQQVSQAVAPVFECLSCQIVLRFIQHFSIPEITETLKGFFTFSALLDTRNLKYRRVLYEMIRYSEAKQF